MSDGEFKYEQIEGTKDLLITYTVKIDVASGDEPSGEEGDDSNPDDETGGTGETGEGNPDDTSGETGETGEGGEDGTDDGSGETGDVDEGNIEDPFGDSEPAEGEYYEVYDTIRIKNYFKTTDGNTLGSAVKTVTMNGEKFNISDFYYYSPEGGFVANNKRNVAGTVFSDIIDESKYSNSKDQGLTIKSGDGNDIITGSRYNDTIVGGKGNNEVILKDSFGDDTLVTTRGETVDITYDGSIDKLEYVLDGKNVKAIANNLDTTYCLKAMVYITQKPYQISEDKYCTVDSKVKEAGGITITVYDKSELNEDGTVDSTKGKPYNIANRAYTNFYMVKDDDGNYKWQSENLLAAFRNDVELRLDAYPEVDAIVTGKLEDTWTNTGEEEYDYMLMNTNIFRVEDNKEINISKKVATLMNRGEYDESLYYGREAGLNGSVSIIDMASKNLGADVLVNGTNLEKYLSTDGYLNVYGEKKLTGTRFNDRFVGSNEDDTITGKAGNNLYEIDTTHDFGNDTVVLSKDETMTLDFNEYETTDLKYELVNGGKDIKISSKVAPTSYVPGPSYEIRGTLDLSWIEFDDEDGTIISSMLEGDEAQDPIEVVYKLEKNSDGEYKWMSDNILKDIAPDANPIRLELSLEQPELPEESRFDWSDGIFSKDYPGYEYDGNDESGFIEEIYQEGYTSITVTLFDIHAYKINGNGDEEEISSQLNADYNGDSYDPTEYIDKDVKLTDFAGTVTLKDFGQKDLGATVKVGEKDLAKYLSGNGVVEVKGGKGKITATRFNDDITGSTSADKIYTYDGRDKVNAGLGNDSIYLGDGNKTLAFKSGDGNDIIYSADLADSVKLAIDGADSYSYSRNGNNLVITRVDDDGKTVEHKLVKTLYVTKNGDLAASKAKGSTKVTDKLYSYEVTNDDGTKVTKYSTTVKDGMGENPKNLASKQFYIRDGKIIEEHEHNEALYETITVDGYFKNGDLLNNIVVNNKDLLKDILLTGDKVLKYGTTADYKKAQTFYGTQISEEFVGGKGKDKIYTGAGVDYVNAGKGNDTINLDGAGNKIVTFTKGDGNDTITMNAVGVNANLVFDATIGNESPSATEGALSFARKGNDLAIIRNYGSKKTLQTTTVKDYFVTKTIPEGETTSTLSINGTEFNPKSVTFDYSGSGTISFTDGYNYNITTGKKNDNITLSGGSEYSVDSGAGNDVITITGNKANAAKGILATKTNVVAGKGNDTVTISNGNNYVSAGAGNDKVTITGNGVNELVYTSGKDVYEVGTGNDTYNINFGKSTDVTITDKGGEDTIYLRTKSAGFTCFFNVDDKGKIVDNEETLYLYDSNSLKFSKRKLTGGVVKIENYFKTGEDSGHIENIIINNGDDFRVASWANDLQATVGKWLSSNGYEGKTAMDVIQTGSSADVKELLAIYQTGVDYNAPV